MCILIKDMEVVVLVVAARLYGITGQPGHMPGFATMAAFATTTRYSSMITRACAAAATLNTNQRLSWPTLLQSPAHAVSGARWVPTWAQYS